MNVICTFFKDIWFTELRRLRIFSVLVGSFIYFLRDAKYIATIFFKFAPADKN